MHSQGEMWLQSLKRVFPPYFEGKRVLEIGSADINGNARRFFTGGEYVGLDVAPYQGVDVVCIAHEYEAEPFDVVFSIDAFEHDMHWRKTLHKMEDLLKPDGLMFIQAAYNWDEHGTRRSMPDDSLTSALSGPWQEYYLNLAPENILEELNKEKFIFTMSYVSHDMDTRFIGLT
jgi:SAM-dependent methyltransferase